MKKRGIYPVFFALIMIFVCAALPSCYVGGTPYIESAEWDSDKELTIHLSGQPSDYELGAEVSIDGKKDSSYYINVDIYNPFTFKVKVKLNKSVPKGAFVTIFATDRSGDLTGSVTLERK